MPGLPFGLAGQLGRQQPVRLAPVAAGGQLDDRRPGEWVAEYEPVGSIIDVHQPGLLGGSKSLNRVRPGRRLQDVHVFGAVQRRQQQQLASPGGKSRDP
jgi:hypothetical protein